MYEKHQSRLSRHYDKKYSHQCVPTDTIPFKRFPHNRFEAAVKYGGKGKRLLEIGAGNGNVLQSLAPFYEECVGVEICRPRVKILKEIFAENPNVTILCHNLEQEQLPFGDEHFDTILMIDVIEHLIEPISTIIELKRILISEGRLIIATPNIAKWTRRIKLLLGVFPSTASLEEGLRKPNGSNTNLFDEGHLHYFTYKSLSRLLLEHAGFSETIWHGHGRAGPLCKLWPTFFGDISLTAIR